MFCGHLDTVGVEGMIDPFAPRVEGGRLYGRGAQDMKGGVAAMIAAAGRARRAWTRGRLIVAAVVDEEHMSLGAEALVREWRADMAVVTEPTDLAARDRSQGLRVDRDRHARPRRARQPSGRRTRRDRAHGPRARRARGARSGTARAPAGAVSGHGIAARVDRQRRPRAQQLSRSLRAADGAPHRRGRGRRASCWPRSTQILARLRAPIRSSTPMPRLIALSARRTRSTPITRCRGARRAPSRAGRPADADRHVVLDRRGDSRRCGHSLGAVRSRRRGPAQPRSST